MEQGGRARVRANSRTVKGLFRLRSAASCSSAAERCLAPACRSYDLTIDSTPTLPDVLRIASSRPHVLPIVTPFREDGSIDYVRARRDLRIVNSEPGRAQCRERLGGDSHRRDRSGPGVGARLVLYLCLLYNRKDTRPHVRYHWLRRPKWDRCYFHIA